MGYIKYWKYFAIAGSVNALIFVGYRLHKEFTKLNDLNEKDKFEVKDNTDGKEEDND